MALRSSGSRRWVVLVPLALLIAHAPSWFLFGDYTLRMAVVLVAGPVGLLALAQLVRVRDPAGLAAGVLALWVLVAGIFSGAPLIALRGMAGRESTGLVVILALGLWALGRQVDGEVVVKVPYVIVVGLSVSALVGIVQVGLGVESGWVALQFGRATGLTPNPVYFGALMAAGAVLCAWQPGWSWRWRILGVGGFAFAANLSGSRVAIVVGVAAVGVAAATSAMSGRRPSDRCLAVGAYAAGIVVSTVFTKMAPDAISSTDRLVTSETGGRLDAWRYGLAAVADRPVAGFGFGRFRAATQARFSPEFVDAAAFDDVRQAWFDAHNVVIGVVVAIGVVGLALAAWFVVAASRRCDAGLAAVAAAIAATWLLQPLSLATFPLAMFLLGCAGPRAVADEEAVASRWSTASRSAVLVGVLVAGLTLIGDLSLRRAADAGDVAALERGARLFPADSVVQDLVAQVAFARRDDGPGYAPTALDWSRRAVETEPDRPYLWRQHGTRLFVLGDADAALAAFRTAIDLQPWHLQSWQSLYTIGELTEDEALLDEAGARLCELGRPAEGASC